MSEFIEGSGHQPCWPRCWSGTTPRPMSMSRTNTRHMRKQPGSGQFCTNRLPKASQADLVTLVEALGDDDAIDGILVQLPPRNTSIPRPVIRPRQPGQDVDGLTATNGGLLAGGRAPSGALLPAG